MDVEKIKNNIKEIMAKRSITAYQLARDSGLSEACIRNWFAANRNYNPRLDALVMVCKALGVSVARLCMDEGEELVSVTPRDREMLHKIYMLNEREVKAVQTVIDAFYGKGTQ